MSLDSAPSNHMANDKPCFRSPRRVLSAVWNCNWLLPWINIAVIHASVGFTATPVSAEEAQCAGFSFAQPPFVSPRIIQDLETWISDRGEQVVAINLSRSAESNRYSGEVTTVYRDNSLPPIVVYKDEEAFFSYRLIGRTPAAVYVLRTTAGNGDGSGTFQNLLLVTLSADRGFSYDKETGRLAAGRQRCLIKRMEAVPLGDGYDGEVSLDGNILHIGADANPRGAGLFPDNVEMIVPAPPSN